MLLRVLLENLTRLLLVGTILLMGVAVLELALQALGLSLIGNYYAAGRLLEMSAIFAVVAIALTLREIRELLRQNGNGEH